MKITQDTANDLMDKIEEIMIEGYCLEGKEEIVLDKQYFDNVAKEAVCKVFEIIGVDEIVEGE